MDQLSSDGVNFYEYRHERCDDDKGVPCGDIYGTVFYTGPSGSELMELLLLSMNQHDKSIYLILLRWMEVHFGSIPIFCDG